jgi:8-oxo-dGTP pyrophosphatase MutT (NUDIX family)
MLQRRFRTILTARLLLEYREHLLFLQQTPRNGGGFTLPGGKIEGEEFAKEALIREAFEEVGIIVTHKNLKLVHITHKKVDSVVEVIFFFHCRHVWAGEPTVKEPEKFQNVVWLPMDEPPAKLTSVLTHALGAWKDGKIFSQFPKSKKKVEDIIAPIIALDAVKPTKKAEKKIEKPIEKKIEKKEEKQMDLKDLKKADKKVEKKEDKTDDKKAAKKGTKKEYKKKKLTQTTPFMDGGFLI